ncbi:phospholipase D-like domain-containing protein [Cellulomonas alba]|uniref:Phospholipase D-like domain-containing protein n=1 Tax=Cellulomonas alba TaxID=3053467 RepID=A0ABT7SCI0_9CELL|nr:phospholipase D-like domain-containing protein [Cellulomonas alba]MDM7853893.1 phospholipase D-like domain-containing protein [Cellulomonas alba]
MADPSEWLLTAAERANPHTRLDDRHPDGRAWSEGNLVVPLIHGATYFQALYDALEATGPGDLVMFTDWQGDADERLTGEAGSEVVEVLCRADERGAAVHGLVWRSHLDQTGFFATENRHLGEQLDKRGAEVLLDMRVRAGGSHHQKFVVIRHRDDPTRDVAFVGGIDLSHNRRDDANHAGDPQPQPLAQEYGQHPPWHDVQVAIQGPAVHDVETVFRERWEDPAPVSMAPWRRAADRLRGLDSSAGPLPEQWPPPPPAGSHTVQLLRTYPNLGVGRDYPFARGGERSVARGYHKAVRRSERLVYVEDQYFWGHDVARVFEEPLRARPELRLVVVVPMVPDVGGVNRVPQLLGRQRALGRLQRVAPDRVAAYGIENHAGVPVYVHAKVCVVDDTWASTGSDNFNRRSWTHDSELTAVVLDEDYARRLRLTLAAEHLDRAEDVAARGLEVAMADVVDPVGMFDTYAEHAARLDAWHAGGRLGVRPPGRLRRLPMPDLTPAQRRWARLPLDALHDPDGRPPSLRKAGSY